MREHNQLYLIWKDPKSRRNYIVGKLEKTKSGYAFEYCKEYAEALKAGWGFVQAFAEEKRYESKELFPAFASRLPDKKRRDIAEILNRYGLESYDGFELLKQSGGRLPIDTFEFIDPIFDEDKTIEKIFYVMGIRHVCACNGTNCSMRPQLSKNARLVLQKEPDNQYDPYAIQVKTKEGEPLGYVPRYYSQGISERLDKDMSYECTVLEISKKTNCQECLKVKLRMPKQAEGSV